MHGKKSTVFGSNFHNGDFDGFTCLRSPESKNHIFRAWSVCVYLSVINITQRQIMAENPNLVLYICIMRKCNLKLFYKVRTNSLFKNHTFKLIIPNICFFFHSFI